MPQGPNYNQKQIFNTIKAYIDQAIKKNPLNFNLTVDLYQFVSHRGDEELIKLLKAAYQPHWKHVFITNQAGDAKDNSPYFSIWLETPKIDLEEALSEISLYIDHQIEVNPGKLRLSVNLNQFARYSRYPELIEMLENRYRQAGWNHYVHVTNEPSGVTGPACFAITLEAK